MQLLPVNPRHSSAGVGAAERDSLRSSAADLAGLADPAKTILVSNFTLAAGFEGHPFWRHRIANEAHLSSRRLLRH